WRRWPGASGRRAASSRRKSRRRSKWEPSRSHWGGVSCGRRRPPPSGPRWCSMSWASLDSEMADDEARQIADELRAVAAFGLNFARHGSHDADRWERVLAASARLGALAGDAPADGALAGE